MTGNEIRNRFLEYFEKKQHQVVRSSSLIPSDDPTLLFINAGMVQFKRIFLGEEKRGYHRAVTSQKCVRAGGKHNDLENVGYTARHHTFFEMLGNFSFGDYFKEKATEYAWELLTDPNIGYGLPEDKLWVSIYLDDDEAFNIWSRNIGVPEDKIVRMGEEDNFWSMGDTGPCGPCSEIHLDRGADFGCGKPDCKLGCDCDRYLEIWNLVFMQFNRDADGKMTPLPKPSIDTGLGLERMASILQNTETNFETDLLLPVIQKAGDLADKTLGANPEDDVALKVIADHSRASAFLIGDGILPSNEGRGYVLRRIMRRAIRYGRNIGLVNPFLYKTAGVVFDIMKDAYPELSDANAFITNVIRNEEERFSETLDHGLTLLNDTLAELEATGEKRIPGDIIFKLYDTYGFPVDIVRDVIRDKKMVLDMDGFNSAMENQRVRSRSVSTFTGTSEAYKTLSARGVKPEFVGYEALEHESGVLILVKDGEEVHRAENGERVEIITESTPFYGESGGQVGDAGRMMNVAGSDPAFEISITDTVKDPTGLIIHRGDVLSGMIEKGSRVKLIVDKEKRMSTACNHTATHILHATLRKVLGDHVKQAGSMVSSDRLRFDFTHFSKVTPQELTQIENLVNQNIRKNSATIINEMNAEEALKSGATALFEEKYGDRVRVVTLASYSRELCGGTHTDYTGNIGVFIIIGESSVASGIRRIEALTGAAAVAYIQNQAMIISDTAERLKEKPEMLVERVEKLITDNKAREKEIERLKSEIASKSADRYQDEIIRVGDVKVLAKKVTVDNPAALRDLADKFKDKMKSGIILLGSISGPKVFLIVVVTSDLTDRYHAGRIIKQAAVLVGGGGGGRPDMAQAGGTKPEKLDSLIDQAAAVIEKSMHAG